MNINLGESNFFSQTFYRAPSTTTQLSSVAPATYEATNFIPSSHQIYQLTSGTPTSTTTAQNPSELSTNNIDISINHVLASLAQSANNPQQPIASNPATITIENSLPIATKSKPGTINHGPTIILTTSNNLNGDPAVISININNSNSPISTSNIGSSVAHNTSSKSTAIKTSSSLSSFPCHVCGKPLKSKQSLAVHIKTHTKPYACHLCGARFSHSMLKELHEHSHDRKQQKELEESKRPYKCTVDNCGKCFWAQHKLTAHLKVHNGAFTCSVCHRGFSSNASLSRHVVGVHGDENPFKCPTPGCEKSFCHSSYLSRHLRSVTHSGFKRFGCSSCNKSYASQRALNYHILSTHEDGNVSEPKPPGPEPKRKRNADAVQ